MTMKLFIHININIFIMIVLFPDFIFNCCQVEAQVDKAYKSFSDKMNDALKVFAAIAFRGDINEILVIHRQHTNTLSHEYPCKKYY